MNIDEDLLDQPEPEGEGLTDQFLIKLMPVNLLADEEDALAAMRAAIAADRARRPTPQPPAAGEVAEVIAVLRDIQDCFDIASGMEGCGPFVARAAELLQRFALPACLVVNPDKEALAVSMAADPAGTGRFELLPDDAQIIEPSERTVLVSELADLAHELRKTSEYLRGGCGWDKAVKAIERAIDLIEGGALQRFAPVPVSERPWEREGWCDAEGRCWIFMPDIGTDPSWRLTDPRDTGPYHTHSLPANALPTP